MKRFLLIVDLEQPDKISGKEFNKLLKNERTKGSELHLLAFCEDPLQKIPEIAKSVWSGPIRIILAEKTLDHVSSDARRNIIDFTAELRLRIKAIALTSAGKKWAAFFEQKWWNTVLAERNAGNPVWWLFYRFYAIQHSLSENHYDHCVLWGSKALKHLTRQICQRGNLSFEHKIIEQKRSRFPKHLQLVKHFTKRFIAFIFHITCVILAKSDSSSYYQSHPSKKLLFVYSWFPRVWTHRGSEYQDMYYGSILKKCAERNLKPVYVFRMYDKIEYLSPKIYRKRLKKHAETYFAHNTLIFESYIRIWDIVKAYFNIFPVFCFLMTTMHRGYKECFQWNGINYSYCLTPFLWYSITQLWPSMTVLQNGAKEIDQSYKPNVTLLYSFEYIFGRAIISGIRNAREDSIVLGMQHGVFSPNKLKFYAKPNEISTRSRNKQLLPEPDYIIFDGEGAKEIYATRGIENSRLLALGPARFDSIWEIAKSETNKLRLSKMPITVLVAPGLHDADFMIGFAVKALAADINIKMVIKAHPKYTKDRVRNIVDSHFPGKALKELGITIASKGDIYLWMQKADLMLVTYSSTGLEAVAFGLPVIVLSSSRTPNRSPFYSNNASVLCVDSADALLSNIRLLIGDKSLRSQYMKTLTYDLHKAFGTCDSKASNRIADAVFTIIEQSNH